VRTGTARAGTGRVRASLRGWRLPILLGLAVLAAGVVIALLQPPAANYLAPGDTSPDGGHALFDLLTARGQHVVSAPAPESAGQGSGHTGAGDAEIITSPDYLTRAQLTAAGRFPGDILLVGPTAAALSAIAPAVVTTGQSAGNGALPPLCNDQAANLAGSADLGGTVLETGDPGAAACYPSAGGYLMAQYASQGRTITVLGSGDPLTNQYLASGGDAALALNLLRQARTIYWVVPPPGAAPPAATGQASLTSLVPWPVHLIVIQLAVAALLAAAWRARRLGPLVAERLPVVVRASETVEGHGRLYRARRARDRAAGELRRAARDRISRSVGAQATDTQTIAARTGESPDDVTALLYGPPPGNDAQLVALADDLDTLERKVRQS
jgi:hypothetical protein